MSNVDVVVLRSAKVGQEVSICALHSSSLFGIPARRKLLFAFSRGGFVATCLYSL